ncbi:MAG: TIGR03960 family B12-binding radical SAM protein, partial [Armatimonadota bacterium]
HILNSQPWVWAERAYAPGLDMEAELRQRGLLLFSLESKTPLRDFDAVGFTLQYELSYTNVLNMLELGGIPLLSGERTDRDPIIIAGGPCAFNPEPLADFVDAFAIGDGEELILDVVEALRETKGLPREQRIRRISQIEGIYVPAFVAVEALSDGTLVPSPETPKIKKRVLHSLEDASFPTAYIVPYTEQAHDRVSLEVLRGCTQACRFCQAGMTYRPVRERTVETLERLTEEVLHRTGYDEVALSSLSTCDYSRVRELVRRTAEVAAVWGASVSLPSLRLDSFSLDLADMVQTVRKSGLTFAPEAATPKMRAVINKWISDDELLSVTRQVYERGWDLVKLYFMIGLPMETDEDVVAIAELARRVVRAGREVNPRARVNLGVSTFVPKPHTPFQWERQISIEETLYKQDLLKRNLRDAALKFGRHDANMSYLEGVFSRGDRRLAKVLLGAFRRGARFDAWSEHFNLERWLDAFADEGLDPNSYLRQRTSDEPLPWDHIDPLVSKRYLLEEYHRVRQLEQKVLTNEQELQNFLVVRDCRYQKCHQCGVMDHVKPLCISMLSTSRQGRKLDAERSPAFQVRRPRAGEPAQRIRFRYERVGDLRFLSHRETMNVLARALRRARVPVHYTQGFNPQPKLALGAALPVGMESIAEYGDVVLDVRMQPAAFCRAVNAVLPEGLRIVDAKEVPMNSESIMSQLCAERYRVEVEEGFMPYERVASAVETFKSRSEVLVEREGKGGIRTVDVRPMVKDIKVLSEDGHTEIEMFLQDYGGNKVKVHEVLSAVLGVREEESRRLKVRKLESYIRNNEGALVPPLQVDCRSG